jgi:cytochrome c-type biogenesis protein
LETFVSGFAIATGCLACFGGAILGVLLVYTGLLGSPLLGALAMFTFSMGLAVPFLLAALSLSWVMPVALRLQRLMPVIGLLASAAMLFFGIVMVTGNFHVVSGWLFQHLPLS